jgi:hypothetical protein
VSLGQAAEHLWRATSDREPPPITRYADLALGLAKKDVDVILDPRYPASGEAEDRGLAARLSPYNSFDGPGALPGLDEVLRLRLDLGFAMSTLNRGQPQVHIGNLAEPIAEQDRRGWSARLALHPADLSRELDDSGKSWLDKSLTPLFSVGAAWEDQTDHFEPTSGPGSDGESDIAKHGVEVTVLNILSLRRGHVSDPDGGIVGSSSGWSVGFSFAGAAGFRYDRATVPQSSGFSKVERRAWSVFVDPLNAVRELRRR